MQTKYDVGEEVLVKAVIRRIDISSTKNIKYVLELQDWCSTAIKIKEEEIFGTVKRLKIREAIEGAIIQLNNISNEEENSNEKK